MIWGFNLILFILLILISFLFENLLIVDILCNFSNELNMSSNMSSNIINYMSDSDLYWRKKPSIEIFKIKWSIYPPTPETVRMPDIRPEGYFKPTDYNVIIQKFLDHELYNPWTIEWFKLNFEIDSNILHFIHYNNYMFNYYHSINYSYIIDRYSSNVDLYFKINKNMYINGIIQWIVDSFYFHEHLRYFWCNLSFMEFDQLSWEIISKIDNYPEKIKMLKIMLAYLNTCIESVSLEDEQLLNCRHSRIILRFLIKSLIRASNEIN
jgi:hypothetical protein